MNKFKASKKSLSMKENLKSWNRGTKKKMIAEPGNAISKSSRNGLIFT